MIGDNLGRLVKRFMFVIKRALGQRQKQVDFGGGVGERFFANGDEVGSVSAFDEGGIFGIAQNVIARFDKGTHQCFPG